MGQVQEQMLRPGTLWVPTQPSLIGAVVASTAVLCVFDARMQRGGMAHYCRPYREKGMPSTARYAGPAIVGLVRMLEQAGARAEDLDVHLLGGASNEAVACFEKGLAQENIKVGLEILSKLGLSRVSVDTGGNLGRRVRFNTGTGQVQMRTIDHLSADLWYPCKAHKK